MTAIPLSESASVNVTPVQPTCVAVLLATYNGQSFLDEQLRSILEQSHQHIDIWASDDGSTDATSEILVRWQTSWPKGRFNILNGPSLGFAENFRHLITTVEGAYAGYFFSDQDDIWHSDKVERALHSLRDVADRPALYGARTKLVDANARPIGFSPLFANPKSFQNALVQSMAGGNTMMFNPPAFDLLAESARRTGFVTHDWWAYILITGCGGTAIYDPEPNILYRQHTANVLGKNSGIWASLHRLRGLFVGRFQGWTAENIQALEACSDLLTPAAKRTLTELKAAHAALPFTGFAALRRSGVYRQNFRGNLALWLACALGRI